MKQGTAEWREQRLGKITGTRFVAAMAGYETKAFKQLVDLLVYEHVHGESEDHFFSDAMAWGLKYESRARQWYEKHSGSKVREVAFVAHPRLPLVGASPDGLVGRSGMIEIKCPQRATHDDFKRRGALPSRYAWQVQGLLWVSGRKWLDFVSFYPPRDGVVVRVLPNRWKHDMLNERCLEISREVTRRLRRRR